MTVNTTRNYYEDMVKMIPLYERKSKVFLEVFRSYNAEFKSVIHDVATLENDMFVDTAVNSLSIYERDLGITSTQGLQTSQRREQISSRQRASFDQTTEETIQAIAAAYSNGDVEVNPTSTVGLYEIKFVGTLGIPDNLDGLKKAIDIVIPAHLNYTFEFKYVIYDTLKANYVNYDAVVASGLTYVELLITEGGG
jgi:hypothetical protein